MKPPPLSRCRITAVVTGILVLFLQLFAEGTIAKEKKSGPQTFSATEKNRAVKHAKAVVPAELLAVEKNYLKSKTFEAEFTQRDEVKLTGAKKESTGILMIRHPDQFRWETLKPDKNLLISDGKKFWFYTPPFEAGERGQVIERKTTEVQSELANSLLAGSFSKVHGVEIKKLSPTRFLLTPADGVAGSVKTAELEIDPTKNVIRKLQLVHSGGNRTEISLADVKLSGKMSEAFFRFVTPPGTDVIRE